VGIGDDDLTEGYSCRKKMPQITLMAQINIMGHELHEWHEGNMFRGDKCKLEVIAINPSLPWKQNYKTSVAKTLPRLHICL
jgi:hypothetical protein